MYYAQEQISSDWQQFGDEASVEVPGPVFRTTAFPISEAPPMCRGFICLRHTNGVQYFATFSEETALAANSRKFDAQPVPEESGRESA
jgi:hypothetical protein